MQTLLASECGLSTAKLSPAILDIIDSLSQAGYEAYIVGGCVRDLLLGLSPKDFDAVTNATPSQIKKVFGRRCRIIGRRFELAHVYSGRELIEVATFRAPPKQEITSKSGMILRDNNWGTIEQDFARRDFTINTLYYQPRKGIILDFCNAYRDIQQKTLRLLGDAKQRFDEDPVRMMRSLRFAAKLGFRLDKRILAVFDEACANQLLEVSPHRLYDETQKMFAMGKLGDLLPLLIDFNIWQQILADVKPEITPFILKAAQNTDERLQADKSVNPAFFYAVLMWQAFVQRFDHYRQSGMVEAEARVQASIDVLKRQATRTIIPRFAESFIRETWEMQSRLVTPKAQHILSISQHPRFRAAFDFLLLREQTGDETTQGMAQWWAHFQTVGNDEKERLIAEYRLQQQRNRKKEKDKQVNKAKAVQHEEMPPLSKSEKGKKRKAKKTVEPTELLQQLVEKSEHSSSEPALDIPIDHPILKRRRVQRDLSQVIFGPTQ